MMSPLYAPFDEIVDDLYQLHACTVAEEVEAPLSHQTLVTALWVRSGQTGPTPSTDADKRQDNDATLTRQILGGKPGYAGPIWPRVVVSRWEAAGEGDEYWLFVINLSISMTGLPVPPI